MLNTATNGARGTLSSGTTAARITKPPATTRLRRTASTGASRSMITGSKPERRRNRGAQHKPLATVRNGNNLERFPGEKPGSISRRHEQRVKRVPAFATELVRGLKAHGTAYGFVQGGSAARPVDNSQ